MMKMESKKSRRLRWLDCFLGPINSNSKWLQENLEEINGSVGWKLKMIEDSDADSFAEKVEMYNESRQELNNLVDKCYNHGRAELLNNIPNSGRDISISNVSSRPLLSRLRSSKQPNAPECSEVSKQLKRGVSEIGRPCFRSYAESDDDYYYLDIESDDDDGKEGSDYELEADLCDMIEKLDDDGKEGSDYELEADLRNMIEKLDDDGKEGSDYELEADLRDMIEKLDDDGKEGSDYELEADLRDMIEKLDDDGKEGIDYELEADLLDMIENLYIQMEWDRVVSMLQHRILRQYEDDGQVKESVSSNVDKALLEETLELHSEICRRLNQMSYLEEYNEEVNATNLVASLFELALSKCWCF